MKNITERENKQPCSFMRCLSCPHRECYTGQMARKKGKKGYEAVIKELERAIW